MSCSSGDDKSCKHFYRTVVGYKALIEIFIKPAFMGTKALSSKRVNFFTDIILKSETVR